MSDAPNYPKSYCKSKDEELVEPVLSLFDLKNIRLQYIFNKEFAELKKSFSELEMIENALM